MKLLCLVFSTLFFATSMQAQHAISPGSWGGTLELGTQSTPFYLDIRNNEENEIAAYLTLPVTNFHELSLGKVEIVENQYRAGSIQFSLDHEGSKLTGSFHSSPRDLRFSLSPVEMIHEKKQPFEGESTALPDWTFKTDGAIWGGAATDGEHVFIGSTDRNLYSLDSGTGQLLWSYKTGGTIYSKPLVNNEFIYVLSDDGFLYKLRKENGERVWTFETGAADWTRSLPDDDEPGYDTMGAAPVSSGEQVFIGSPDGHIYAVEKTTGEENWRFQTEGPVLSTPAVENGILYVGSNDHHLYAIDTESGELKWKFDTDQVVISSPAVQNGLVITGSRSADHFALNTETGEPVWTYFFWFSWVESSGVFYDDHFYIGSSDNQLLKAFDPANGQLIWSFDTGGSPWAKPAITDESVFTGIFGNANYFIDHRGGFVAVDRKTGNEKWRFVMDELPGTHIYGVISSPVITNGKVMFGGLDGVVYGFSTN